MNDTSPKPNWLAVGLSLALIVGWLLYSSYRWPTPQPPAKPAARAEAAAQKPAASAPAIAPSLKSAPKNTAPETRTALANGNLRAIFTSRGGGVARIDLLQHAAQKNADPVVLNGGADDITPVFSLTGWDAAPAAYAQSSDAQSVTYTRTLPGGLRLERRYTLAPGDGYQIELEQKITNPGAQAVTLPEYGMEIGAALPLYDGDLPQTVSANWAQDEGKRYGRVNPGEFNPSNGFLSFGAHPARDAVSSPEKETDLRWAAVKNRFFALVVVPPADRPISSVVGRPVTVFPPGVDAGVFRPATGIQAEARFAPLTLAAGETRTEHYVLYAGPKEHGRLAALGHGAGELMEFGFWSWVAIPLMSILEALHHVIPNYGWVIVFLTLALKIIFWPLQSAANHSMKQMQALAPKQKELSEKYKSDPQRMQMEVMKLYKEYGVNPVGGCLPVLIQIPIFFGFYTMLQSAVQFRHQSWLWVHDLVKPDTIALLPGLHLPVNPLPIIMAVSQWVVMKMTPQATENPQMKIMQFMPLVMLVLFYNFAAALALYWTVNNLVTAVQTYHNLRKPIPLLHRIKKKKKS
ncbi:MAG: membrane protein insertase YidC [Verrucomicrobium sp.]|nr:membrane protein insertase YidC [Verrucomicrobium sp.]